MPDPRVRTALLAAVLAFACSKGVRKDAGPAIAGEAPAAAAREAGVADPPALTPGEMAEHVLSRTTFGARQQDRERLARLGVAGFLEEQLDPDQLDDSALDQRLASIEVLQKSPGELAHQLASERRQKRREVREQFLLQLSEAKLLRAVLSRRQLQEELVAFWFDHFGVVAGKEQVAALLPDYEEGVLRRNALGTFPELLSAAARSPAVLIQLDNWRSTAPPPPRQWAPWLKHAPRHASPRARLDESFARALLEQHTLGPGGGFTAKDVTEVARCFTGWTVERPQKDPRFAFHTSMHDFGPKRVLGHEIAPGGGIEDGEEVLRILAAHPSTAHFVARKLAMRFVSDDPPEKLVGRLADTYQQTRGDVREMLRTLFVSPEFWSRKAVKAKVRSPLELVAAAVRGLDGKVDDAASLARAVARIGQPLYAEPPDLPRAWLSPGSLTARSDFGLQLAGGQLEGVTVDLSQLAGAPEDLLRRAAGRLGAAELSEKTRERVLGELRKAKPEMLAARAVGLLLGAPETQRR